MTSMSRLSIVSRVPILAPLVLFIFAACGPPPIPSGKSLDSSAARSLGAAAGFAVLGGSTVTCTNASSVTGDVGVSPGTAITGFNPDCTLSGTIHAGDAVVVQAHDDLAASYGALGAVVCEHNLTGQELGGLTLTPGVYCFDSSVGLTGQLTLDGAGDSSAAWIFEIGSTVTTAANSSVVMAGGGQPCNVFWRVGSSATLGTGTAFKGNLLASASITLTTASTLNGRAMAVNAAVTMDRNDVSLGSCAVTPVQSPDAGVSPVDAGSPESAPDAGLPIVSLAPSLGAATQFAVLGASTVTCTNASTVKGDVGVSPGTAITGFNPDCTVAGTIHAGDAVATQAHSDLALGYTALTAATCEHNLTGQDLGGLTLAPGVYCFNSSVGLTGQLTLDAAGAANAAWIFQIGSTITAAANSSVVMAGSGQPCNVFWQVGSSATIGQGAAFQGNLMASASITLVNASSLVGRALAVNAAVTMDHNDVIVATCAP